MEMILAPLDVQFGQDMWKQPPSPPLGPVAAPASEAKSSLVRLPSLFAKDRSPRLVGMSDVLSAQAQAASPQEHRMARLPSIDAMIRRDESPRSPVEYQDSLSPVRKQCMDLYKQLQDVPASPLGFSSPHRDLLAGAALSQLATMQQRTPDKKRRLSTSSMDSVERQEKMRRPNSAKLCGMADCKKRAKAGGFCIAHGGGLRCSEEGCQKHAVSLGLCISHGGGKRCTVEGCMNASRKNGVCWSHGGKRLCKLEGCNKGPKSGGYCWSHGGKLKK